MEFVSYLLHQNTCVTLFPRISDPYQPEMQKSPIFMAKIFGVYPKIRLICIFDRFGVYAEDTLPAVNAHGDSPAYLLRERCQRFPPAVKLPTADEVGQIP